MMKSDEIMCVVCNRSLSAQDQAAYGNRCEDCWCAGPSGAGDLRYSGGPYSLFSKETRGRPSHRVTVPRGAARCYSDSLTTDDLKSITNQGRRSRR